MTSARTYTLPIGLADPKGALQREVTMRAATALDELEIQAQDAAAINDRFRDLLIFSRVISSIGTITNPTLETLEELYETDFLYLQLAFRELNGVAGNLYTLTCPQCGKKHAVSLEAAYSAQESPS